MKMKLAIKKFLGLTEADIEFDKPLSYIFGENGSAKSSIADAIRYVHGAPIRGTKANDRDRLGNDKSNFSIALSLNDNVLKGSAGSVPTIAEVSAAVGVSRKALPYCLEPSTFLTSTPKDLKALFSEVLQLDLDWKAECIKRKCSEQLLAELSSDMKTALKQAKDARAERKKGDEAVEPEDPEVIMKAGKKKASEVPLESLETAITQVEAQYEALVERRSVIMERHVPEEEAKAAAGELAKLKKKLKALPDAAKLREELTVLSDARGQTEKKYAEMQGKQKAIAESAKKHEKMLDVDLCAKCKKKVGQFLAKEQGGTEALEGYMAKAVEEITATLKKEAKLKAKMESTEEKDVRARIAQLESIATEPISDEEIEKLKVEIGAIQERLSNGRNARDIVRDYHNAMTGYRNALEQQKAAGTQWDAWDAICKAIPEVEEAGVAAGLEPLREIMKRHKVLEGDIEITDDLEISYDGRSIDLLSKAEKYLVSLAPYLATLELFKFPFLLCDDGDFIVTKSLKVKLQGVLSAIAAVKPVIFLQARQDDETEEVAGKIKADGTIALYQVKDGTVKRLAG